VERKDERPYHLALPQASMRLLNDGMEIRIGITAKAF
jgi:hypothetical protein